MIKDLTIILQLNNGGESGVEKKDERTPLLFNGIEEGAWNSMYTVLECCLVRTDVQQGASVFSGKLFLLPL